MIIDLSYFKRLIQVASLDKPSIAEQVNEFIVQYEPEYLNRMLGYQLAQDFLMGLQQSTIDQKWLDLLLGATYSNAAGQTQRWAGFAATYTYPNAGASDTVFNWIVGTSGSPVAGQTKFVETRFINRLFTNEKNGSGTQVRLADDNSNIADADYRFYPAFDSTTGNAAGTVEFIKPGITFQPNEIYTNRITGYVGAINNATVNISPIAYYTYFKMVGDIVEQLNGLSQLARSKAENADIVAPYSKMVRVWNNMVDLNRSLTDFLNVNSTTYSSYKPLYYNGNCSQNELLVKLNILGI